MTKRTAYLFYLLTKIKMANLRSILIKSAKNNLMNPKEEHPEGFTCEKNKPDELQYFEDENRHLLFFEYFRWSVRPYLDHNKRRQKSFYPYREPIVVDLETRILYVYSSNISEAIQIAKRFTATLNDPPFERVEYPISYMRWLAEEGQDRSNIIVNVGKTKFEKVSSVDPDTRRIMIDPTLQARNSRFWPEVRDSNIVYSECKFMISETVIPILVYNNGKYTLTSTRGATPQDIGHFLRHVYIELKRLLSIWQHEFQADTNTSNRTN